MTLQARGRWAGALALWWVVGCSVDQSRNPAFRGDCPKDERVDGYCLTGKERDASTADAGQAEPNDVRTGPCGDEGAERRCFSKNPNLVGVGLCARGTQRCSDGAWAECVDEVLPVGEACDELDNDCDGSTDEQVSVGSCETSGRGVCMEGREVCRSGALFCEAVNVATAESCNDDDDDCDGETDEGASEACYQAGAEGCAAQDNGFKCVGLCASGVLTCQDGTLADACAGAITPAASDGCTSSGVAFDDDCDGSVDEDCECTPAETQDCFGGSAESAAAGPCQLGTASCGSNMRFGDCEGDRIPEAETCDNDGEDDDCNGTPDDVPGRGDACIVASAKGVCRTGHFDCAPDGYGCDAPGPSDELCNSLDDDCDGSVDNGFVFATDPANCGACGTTCADGLSCCAGACVNKGSNPQHCGSCGMPCGMSQSCCGGACLNTATDADNCGSCGNECVADCCAGSCVDKENSDSHCGSCGNACTGGKICCAGSCESPSAPACTSCAEDCSANGRTCCNGACADTKTDEAHCGACGDACGMGQVCCNSQCVGSNPLHCGQACTVCTGGDLCCSSGCTPSDASNCNSCGNVCLGGQTCCGTTGCKTLASDPNNCGACASQVPANYICSNGHPCPTGQTWCANINNCTNLKNDRNNCGACGERCLLGLACNNGNCLKL